MGAINCKVNEFAFIWDKYKYRSLLEYTIQNGTWNETNQ